MRSFGIVATGLLGQLLFSARIVVQWAASERARRPVSPAIFWQLSLLGAIALSAYGVMRGDLAIVVGQAVVYFIYVRNLHLMGRWGGLPVAIRWATYVLPVASVGYLAWAAPGTVRQLVRNDVPGGLVAWGIAGQLVFTARFVVQWILAETRGRSALPGAFWRVSLVGSGMIALYAALRRDPVLLVANVAGCAAYARNLVLDARWRRGSAVRP